MALLSNDSQKQISAQSLSPSRAAGYANANSDVPTVEYTDIVLNTKTADGLKPVSVTHRASRYVLTKPPCNSTGANNGIIPNPKIGDRAEVYAVDSSNPNVVWGYMEFVYTRELTSDGRPTSSDTIKWKQVAVE